MKAFGSGNGATGATSGHAQTPILDVDHVRTGYGEVEILHGVSIDVYPGEIVAIIGPNGAGKSTLLKAVVGILPMWSGRVTLDGQDVSGRRPDQLVQLGLGFVPQTDNVFPSLTIRENLEIGAFARAEGVEARIQAIFEMFPVLAERPSERAGRLSGGQRQLLALARALMMEPQVLLLDEPSASLSPAMVDSVFSKIRAINSTGTAVVMVEQNARRALSMANRAYVLAVGENRMEGAAQGMLESDEVRRLYLGE